MVRSIDSVAMRDVAVWILHPEPGAGAGPLERWVATERSRIALRHRDGFLRAGAATAEIVSGPPDDTSFGARLRGLVEKARPRPSGVIVLGSGAVPLATIRDRRSFVATAAAATPTALANNRYSADVVSIACAESLLDLPDLPADNALPRWLEEVAGYQVDDLRHRWRLAFDVDGPLDLLLMGRASESSNGDVRHGPGSARRRRGASRPIGGPSWSSRGAPRPRRCAGSRRPPAHGSGRWSRNAACAQPASWPRPGIGEGRGAGRHPCSACSSIVTARRPSRATSNGWAMPRWSIRGCSSRIGSVPTSVTGRQPRTASRSDLLLPKRVADPWLRELTASAAGARIPVALGGHTLVSVGLRLLLRTNRWT